MAEALARITEVADLGMIQIRADLESAGEAIAAAAGVTVPASGTTSADGARRLCWMSPDELLLVLPRSEVAATVESLNAALSSQHALVLDVSDMRAAFAIEGAKAQQVLMKLCPTDIASMPENGMRRTRAAQVACGIWRQADGFTLIGFRSVGDYLRGLLMGAAQGGTQLEPR
ncbi:sarcosine oxidase subunit gamma family protein [Paracoccus sp. MBLB3053]|uniref:Sarcosine oxidase subunit gamma family protein n=1 Tax=Paracoccus aurantius TaxID=3073814 RepID=A0ABU2HQ36_9RHOB|nr:sarcosine oxidase subunit gamma family protein [Paracoccus sp. MBLB3053]MDS9467143.1 sarcosine oxidase subunit gamma family protein [Paracoccus sp. MBLB3053]